MPSGKCENTIHTASGPTEHCSRWVWDDTEQRFIRRGKTWFAGHPGDHMVVLTAFDAPAPPREALHGELDEYTALTYINGACMSGRRGRDYTVEGFVPAREDRVHMLQFSPYARDRRDFASTAPPYDLPRLLLERSPDDLTADECAMLAREWPRRMLVMAPDLLFATDEYRFWEEFQDLWDRRSEYSWITLQGVMRLSPEMVDAIVARDPARALVLIGDVLDDAQRDRAADQAGSFAYTEFCRKYPERMSDDFFERSLATDPLWTAEVVPERFSAAQRAAILAHSDVLEGSVPLDWFDDVAFDAAWRTATSTNLRNASGLVSAQHVLRVLQEAPNRLTGEMIKRIAEEHPEWVVEYAPQLASRLSPRAIESVFYSAPRSLLSAHQLLSDAQFEDSALRFPSEALWRAPARLSPTLRARLLERDPGQTVSCAGALFSDAEVREIARLYPYEALESIPQRLTGPELHAAEQQRRAARKKG